MSLLIPVSIQIGGEYKVIYDPDHVENISFSNDNEDKKYKCYYKDTKGITKEVHGLIHVEIIVPKDNNMDFIPFLPYRVSNFRIITFFLHGWVIFTSQVAQPNTVKNHIIPTIIHNYSILDLRKISMCYVGAV